MPRLTQLQEVLFPVEEYPVFVIMNTSGIEQRLPVPDKKAIVNRTTHRVLGIMSRDYRLVTNQEAIEMAKQCCRSVFPETKPVEWEVNTSDAPSTASYCHIDLVHNSTKLDFNAVPAAERPDAFGPFIRVTNSYNGQRALTFDIGFYRKVCKNGLILPNSVIRFTFIHRRPDIGEAIHFEVADERLSKLKASFGEYIGALQCCVVPRLCFVPLVCNVLSLCPPDSSKDHSRELKGWNALMEFLGEMGGRYAKELGENAYAVFNTITEFASNPLTNCRVHRDRHSYQCLAGQWLTSFSRECREPNFSLSGYMEEMAKAANDNTTKPSAN